MLSFNVLLRIFLVFMGVSLAEASTNLALKSPYTVSTPANYSLTTDAGDATQLTDGSFVTDHFWAAKGTVGWQQAGSVRIEFDLGAERQIEKLCFNTARNTAAGVYFPASINVMLSSDKQLYASLGDLYQGAAHAEGGYTIQKFCATYAGTVARYVMLVVEPKDPVFQFIFVDEVEVIGLDSVQKTGSVAPRTIKQADIDSFILAQKTLRENVTALLTQLDSLINGAKDPLQKDALVQFKTKLQAQTISTLAELKAMQDELAAIISNSGTQSGLTLWYKNPWINFSGFEGAEQKEKISSLDFNLLRRGRASNAFVITNNTKENQTLNFATTWNTDKGALPELSVREVGMVMSALKKQVLGDPLIPLDNNQLVIKPGESKQVWLTLAAGEALAGNYQGTLKIVPANIAVGATALPVNVSLSKATFPKEQSLKMNLWVYMNERLINNKSWIVADDLAKHHVNVAVVFPGMLPWPTTDSAAKAARYSVFNQRVNYQKQAFTLFFMNFNFDGWRNIMSGGYMSPEWQAQLKTWVQEMVDNMKQQGISPSNFAFYPIDEPRNAEEIEYLIQTGRVIKSVNPNIKVYTTIGFPISNNDLLRLTEVVDIFQLEAKTVTDEQSNGLLAKNKEIWSYLAIEGGKEADPFPYLRLHAWNAFKKGMTGVGLWSYADIGDSGTAWNDLDGIRPDWAVVYEGKYGPVGSKRWEAFAQGVEDYEMLRLAKLKIQTPDEKKAFDDKVEQVLTSADYRQFEANRLYFLQAASK